MNLDQVGLFGEPLGPDPRYQLKLPAVQPPVPGPKHRTQFVVELVGPRTVPASMAAGLLHPQWFGALGQPDIYALRPADTDWEPLIPNPNGSYDSIALAWDILSDRGVLSSQAAAHLFAVATQFATEIQRRAMPMPTPEQIDAVARGLREAQDILDIGISLMVAPPTGSVAERDIWIWCSKLGLEFSGEGSFDWRSPSHPMPLFSITPIGFTDSFSLGQVQANTRHEGVTLGFSVPLCPEPMAALEGAFAAADILGKQLGGIVANEDGDALHPRMRDTIRRDLQRAVTLMGQQRLHPGSSAALSLFG